MYNVIARWLRMWVAIVLEVPISIDDQPKLYNRDELGANRTLGQ